MVDRSYYLNEESANPNFISYFSKEDSNMSIAERKYLLRSEMQNVEILPPADFKVNISTKGICYAMICCYFYLS